MPLTAKITRNEEALPLRWGFWHLMVMTEAVREELEVDKEHPDYPLLNLWSRRDTQSGFTLTKEHSYRDESDGEVLTLLPGDFLHVWREF